MICSKVFLNRDNIQHHLALALHIDFHTESTLKPDAMNKILNYSAIKHYKLPSRKNALKYADTFIGIVFLLMLIKQLLG